MGGEDTRPHLLVLPHVSAGHIVNSLNLAKEIAERGVTVTFVSYEAQISRLTSTDVSFQATHLDLQFVGIRDLRACPSDAEAPHESSQNFEEAFRPAAERLIREKRAGAPGHTAILSDMFFSWSQDIADQLQIPRYFFIPSGAALARLHSGLVELFELGELKISETDGTLVTVHDVVNIPGLPPLNYHELPASCRKNSSEYKIRSQDLLRAAGVVVNSCCGAEGEVMESYNKAGQPSTRYKKIFPVGPLLATGSDHATFNDVGSDHDVEKSITWLDSQLSDSVIYVAFGTLVTLNAMQVHEMAHGLEDSGQRFFWAVPLSRVVGPGSPEDSSRESLTKLLPEGFEARMSDRCRVVAGWVPQLKILAHPAIGAFLTHAGWNSSLEGMTLGKPLIAWPRAAEQHLNARFLVDCLRIAEEIRTGAGGVLDRKEVERAVRVVMSESGGKAIRSQAKDLQRKISEDLCQPGPRSRVLDDFALELANVSRMAGSG